MVTTSSRKSVPSVGARVVFDARGKRLCCILCRIICRSGQLARRSVKSLSVLATVLQLLFHLSAAEACYTNEHAESILQCKLQFARSGQISEFHIFAATNAALCTVPPGDDPLRPLSASTVGAATESDQSAKDDVAVEGTSSSYMVVVIGYAY